MSMGLLPLLLSYVDRMLRSRAFILPLSVRNTASLLSRRATGRAVGIGSTYSPQYTDTHTDTQ